MHQPRRASLDGCSEDSCLYQKLSWKKFVAQETLTYSYFWLLTQDMLVIREIGSSTTGCCICWRKSGDMEEQKTRCL